MVDALLSLRTRWVPVPRKSTFFPSGTLATCPAFLFCFQAAVDNYTVLVPVYSFLQF